MVEQHVAAADVVLDVEPLRRGGRQRDESLDPPVARAEVVADKAARMVAAMADCGCTLNNAYMQLSLLALVVIPDLRISDLGLVDVNKFEIVDLFV